MVAPPGRPQRRLRTWPRRAIRDLVSGYRLLTALKGLTIDVREDQPVALVKAISGLVSLCSGVIQFVVRDIAGEDMRVRDQTGISTSGSASG